MTSAEVRQSFFDFFASKEHTIVPSASLLPTAPNLLFTNAGMNQFVPYFLGEQTPAVSKWPRARPARDTRAADTQKCIRAGGKHNDLDDVGYDAYHQTLFEMLGNWSFGDYFKEEALAWSWELLTEVWKLPKERLYATVYQPGEGDPADFDHEADAIWRKIFEGAGLDPAKHLKTGGKADNFWMMGDTGPCGPCSEIHIDLTPENTGDAVNADSPWCIEIWNNVFIQFNAKEDGSFVPLAQRHVDTGMGFERICGMIATTEGFTKFDRPPSNYDSDLFTPIFDVISKLCGHTYQRTLPEVGQTEFTETEKRDIAFRVLADHIRCLCCAIADGILPSNEGRGYVLRRILRRAVMYGRRLDLKAGFFAQLVGPVLTTLGDTFPELRENETMVRKVIASEEEAFDRTLDRGLAELEKVVSQLDGTTIPGEAAFTLYDTYGFPFDLTEILAVERGLSVDSLGFEAAMEAQRERARAAQKKSVIDVKEGDDAEAQATDFVGFERANEVDYATSSLDLISTEEATFLVSTSTPFYAEMGGQVGDRGQVKVGENVFEISDTQKDPSGRFLHQLAPSTEVAAATALSLSVDIPRRRQIERHHTATHILHWALRKVLGTHVRQAGSYVGPERLRFDFSHFEAVSAEQLAEIEQLCNAQILANDPVQWFETPFAEKPDDVIAFFGEKYGDVVRVVDIGGWSKELCGGTHVLATGEIGLLKIVAESAISAGTRRIEAVAGTEANAFVNERLATVNTLASQFSSKPEEVPARVADLSGKLAASERELKRLKAEAAAAQAANVTDQAKQVGDLQVLGLVLSADNPNDLRAQAVKIHEKLTNGLLVAGANFGAKATLLALASPAAIADGKKAGDIIRELTGKLGGKGGGKPDFAMGGCPASDQLEATIQAWIESLA